MKKFFSALLICLLVASMAITASAKEIRFDILGENEEPFLDDYSEWGEQENMGVPSRFSDNDRYFVYKITFDKDDEYAFMSMNLGNAFVVEASVDNKKFETVLEDEGDTHDHSNLKRYNIDLSKYLKDNESKTVYIQFLDKSPEDGWGVYTFGQVAFYSSSDSFEVTVLSTDKSVEAAENLLEYTGAAPAVVAEPEAEPEIQAQEQEAAAEVQQPAAEAQQPISVPEVEAPPMGDSTFIFILCLSAALVGFVMILRKAKKTNI